MSGGRRFIMRAMLRLYSVPLYVKIMGIGILVTFVFGLVSYYGIRASLFRTHYQIHAEPVLSIAVALSKRVAGDVASQNAASIDRELDIVASSFSDVRYIIVQDANDRVLSHKFTFPTDIPRDLMQRNEELCASCHSDPYELRSELMEVPSNVELPKGSFQAFARPGGLILETTTPIAGDAGGSVRIGVADRIVAREVNAVTRALLGSLAVCLVIGQGLAIGLVYLLVMPIKELVRATNKLRGGEFGARARVYSGDEIGKLATAFNLMAGELQGYRAQVEHKEGARVSLLERLVHAQEEERKSVARELHDQLGQTLSSVLLSFHSLRRDLNLPEARAEQIESEIRHAIDEVRQLAYDIRPSLLDDYGLDSALERYVKEVSRRAGIPIDYQCMSPQTAQRLPNRVEVTLYRVAQEAITNIVRHASATNASVILLRQDNRVTLIVEDNGAGFDSTKVDVTDGSALGLMGMHERVSLLGGELVIESQPGTGAVVRITIPLKQGN